MDAEQIQEGAEVTFVYRLDIEEHTRESTLTEEEVIQVVEWAQLNAQQPIIDYLNHCRMLRIEPSTAGLSNALAEGLK